MKKLWQLSLMLSMLLLLSLMGCPAHSVSQEIPAAYQGRWKCENTKIKWRKKTGFMQYTFSEKTMSARLEINTGNQFSLSLNGESVKPISLKQNKGNTKENGIAWLLETEVSSLVLDEPEKEQLQIALWILPMKEKGVLEAEIRLMEGWDTFPMGDLKFVRED